MRFAADEGVGLGTAFQNFDRSLNEFSVAIQFADVALQWRKISWWQDRMTPRLWLWRSFVPDDLPAAVASIQVNYQPPADIQKFVRETGWAFALRAAWRRGRNRPTLRFASSSVLHRPLPRKQCPSIRRPSVERVPE